MGRPAHVGGDRGSNWGSRRSDGRTAMWKVHSAMVVVQLGFAVVFILSKVAFTSGLNPLVFTVYKDIVSLGVLAPSAYFIERGQRPRLDSTTLALFVLLGFIGIFGVQLLLFFGLALAPAALSAALSITLPIFVFIISAIFGLEVIDWRRRAGQAKVVGVVTAFFGSLLIPLYKGPVLLASSLTGAHAVPVSEWQLVGNGVLPLLYHKIEAWQLGAILLVLGGFVAAVYLTLQSYTLKKYPAPISVLASSYFFGTLMLAATGLLTLRDRSAWVTHEGSAIVAILYMGMISSPLTFALQIWAIFEAGPVLPATYAPLQPFVTTVLAYFVLGESIHLGSVLATALIINGIFFITWGQVRSRKASKHPVETLPTPTGLPVVKGDSNLEPLLG